MDPEEIIKMETQIEARWPNREEIIREWFPKSRFLFFVNNDADLLDVVLSRLPEEWQTAQRITFAEWFHDEDKKQYVGKLIVMPVIADMSLPPDVPYSAFLAAYSCITVINGVIRDVRDSGYLWGDPYRDITSLAILNGVWKLSDLTPKELAIKRVAQKERVIKWVAQSDVTVYVAQTDTHLESYFAKMNLVDVPVISLTEWEALTETQLSDLAGKPYVITIIRDRNETAMSVFLFHSKRYVEEKDGLFYVKRDRLGLSGIITKEN